MFVVLNADDYADLMALRGNVSLQFEIGKGGGDE